MKDSVHFPCEEVNEIARYLFTPAADEAHVAAVIFNSKGHRYGTRPTASQKDHGKYKDCRTRGSGGYGRARGCPRRSCRASTYTCIRLMISGLFVKSTHVAVVSWFLPKLFSNIDLNSR
jgi:hypothetical protein